MPRRLFCSFIRRFIYLLCFQGNFLFVTKQLEWKLHSEIWEIVSSKRCRCWVSSKVIYKDHTPELHLVRCSRCRSTSKTCIIFIHYLRKRQRTHHREAAKFKKEEKKKGWLFFRGDFGWTNLLSPDHMQSDEAIGGQTLLVNTRIAYPPASSHTLLMGNNYQSFSKSPWITGLDRLPLSVPRLPLWLLRCAPSGPSPGCTTGFHLALVLFGSGSHDACVFVYFEGTGDDKTMRCKDREWKAAKTAPVWMRRMDVGVHLSGWRPLIAHLIISYLKPWWLRKIFRQRAGSFHVSTSAHMEVDHIWAFFLKLVKLSLDVSLWHSGDFLPSKKSQRGNTSNSVAEHHPVDFREDSINRRGK